MNRFVSLIVLLAMFCGDCFSMNVDQYSNDSVAKEAPKIIEVTSGEKVFRDGYTYLYDYKFDVRYTGCEYVTVGVEQEYSSYYNVYHFYGPDTAHVYVKNLYANNRVWIDISAENEFGSTKMTIELPPYNDNAPKIIRVYGDTITSGTIPPTYNYSFMVDYEGADYIQVGVEQEFSYDYSTFCVFEPKTAHVTVKDIQKREKAWIDISAENEFGSTKMTIELPPYGNSESNGIEEVEVGKDESVAKIAVYSVNGTFIANIHDISELSNLNRKIVILKYMDAENKVIKTKTIKQ